MKAAACCAISSIEVGTSPLELETPALLNKITSRSRANPSVNAGSQRSMVAVKCTKKSSGMWIVTPDRRLAKRRDGLADDPSRVVILAHADDLPYTPPMGQGIPIVPRLLIFVLSAAASVFAQANPDWSEPFPPFHIAGNLYYVGSKGLANYLVATQLGNILIYSDMESTVQLIEESMERLRFKFKDTKILLISHAHWDHDAGSATIKELTGATYMVMDADVPRSEERRVGKEGR